MKVDFAFSLKDRVRITEIETLGWVQEMRLADVGKQYEVCYFLDGKLETVWLFEDQIEAIK